MEIEELLARIKQPYGEAFWRRVLRDAEMHSTPLFSLSSSISGDVLRLGGSGTLLSKGNSYYVLTAAHVWHQVLKNADRIGLGIREGHKHSFYVEPAHIVTHELPRTQGWNEWGPDLILLQIPDALVGSIKAFRVFYALGKLQDPQVPIGTKGIELYALVGAPEDLGTFSPEDTSVQFLALLTDFPEEHRRGPFDFMDVKTELPQPRQGMSFGGMSGGGLWKVHVFPKQDQSGAEWRARLEGVAFYELDTLNGAGKVRCHGRSSIEQLLFNAPS